MSNGNTNKNQSKANKLFNMVRTSSSTPRPTNLLGGSLFKICIKSYKRQRNFIQNIMHFFYNDKNKYEWKIYKKVFCKSLKMEFLSSLNFDKSIINYKTREFGIWAEQYNSCCGQAPLPLYFFKPNLISFTQMLYLISINSNLLQSTKVLIRKDLFIDYYSSIDSTPFQSTQIHYSKFNSRQLTQLDKIANSSAKNNILVN